MDESNRQSKAVSSPQTLFATVIWLNRQPRVAVRWVMFAIFGVAVCAAQENARSFADGRFALEKGDVVVFLGGENTVIESETSHLESLLTAAFAGRGVRYRNMGWEADTAFAQPREVNFPTIPQQLRRVEATVVFAQFGQMESLRGTAALPEFVAAYEKLLDELAKQTPRIILITPNPFERTDNPLLPDLTAHNTALKLYAEAIRGLARRRGCLCVDLFGELSKVGAKRPHLTDNGFRVTPRGQAIVSQIIARKLGIGGTADRAGSSDLAGAWSSQSFEKVRQTIMAKNRLWFSYWRPTNWAFLGGDRTEQPSSRDHRDPKIRWFPEEVKQFLPMIEAKEREIEDWGKMRGK